MTPNPDDKISLASAEQNSRATLARETILRQDLADTPADASPVSGQTKGSVESSAGTRYGFTKVHAAGGIGRIWLARDRDLDRDVAIKELLPENAGHMKTVARFLREARLTGQLEHPGIVPVYELATRAGTHFYAMRFVRGRTLTAAVESYHTNRIDGRDDPLKFIALLTAFAAVCNAVAYAHSRGVLHRDLKGDNVILGDFGEVIVLDWGLAKIMGQPDELETDAVPIQNLPDNAQDPGLTLQGEVVGTPAYMAPEQAEGRLNDRVSRVWSKALATGELVEINYRLRRADGVYRLFLARGKALRDREGKVVKWFGMLTELDHVE